jgi:hypothetical protein
MRNVIRALVLCILGGLLVTMGPAQACSTDAEAEHDAFTGTVICVDPPQGHRTPRRGPNTESVNLLPVFYPRANIGACGAAAMVNPLACAAPPAAVPQVTAGRVLQAFQRIPLAHLRSQTMPENKTLVNFDTIFYVDARQFRRTVTLLGRRVTLDITPSTFTWHHGDGTSSVTGDPGAPYPSKDVVYRYQDAHRTVAHSVTIVWTARYRVGAGPWQPVPGSVMTTGPLTDLRIAEATPVLSGRR